MKSWMQLVAVVAACALLAACHKQPDLSRLGSPSQRLVGHWMTNSGDQEYYGPVDASGTGSFVMLHADGQRASQRYKIVDEDPATQHLRVDLISPDGSVVEQTNVISEDGESATAAATILGEKVTLAFARADDATAPPAMRMDDPAPAGNPAPAASSASSGRIVVPLPKLENTSDPTLNANGLSHLELTGADGLTPTYGRRPGKADGSPFSHSHAVAQHYSYLLWLHVVAAALLLIATLLFASELGATALLMGWAVALAIGAIGVLLLHAPLLAGVLEIITGGVLVFRAMFQKSDLLS